MTKGRKGKKSRAKVVAIDPGATHLTTEQVGDYLGLSKDTIICWRRRAPIFGPTPRKFSRAVRYLAADVVTWAAAQTDGGHMDSITGQDGLAASSNAGAVQ